MDVKTRCNSLIFMLQRFYQVKNFIMKPLIDVGPALSFDEDELHIDSTRPSAVTTISSMIDNLGSSDLAKRMKESLSRLHKSNHLESVLNYGRMNRTMIIAIISGLVKPPEDISSSESEAEIEAAEEVDLPIFLKERLDRELLPTKSMLKLHQKHKRCKILLA
jgi:hypothetical protein